LRRSSFVSIPSARAGNAQHGDAEAIAQSPKFEFQKSDANKIRTPDEFFA
jgi:hypothetical protein